MLAVEYAGRVDDAEVFESLKVPHVESKQIRDAMDVHASRETGVVDLPPPHPASVVVLINAFAGERFIR